MKISRKPHTFAHGPGNCTVVSGFTASKKRPQQPGNSRHGNRAVPKSLTTSPYAFHGIMKYFQYMSALTNSE